MIKKTDLLIVSCLRKNARETLTKMSRKTKIPVSTIYDRMRARYDNLIIKHTALLDFSKLGFQARANIMIRSDREKRKELGDYLMKHTNVNSLYRINNGFDYMVEVVFKGINQLEDFLEMLDERFTVKQRDVYYVIDDIKRESFMTDMTLVDNTLNT